MNYFGVIAEDMDGGNADNLAKAARQRIKEVGSDVEMSEPEPLRIDGHDWLQFTVKCKVKMIPFHYQYYTYSGKEGSFQIIGWTAQGAGDREAAKLREPMLTFRFPHAKPAVDSPESAEKTK